MSNTQPISQLVNLKRIHGVAFSSQEIYWREHQKWLLESGYRLRPRYQPDWMPSWEKSGEPSSLCEDSFSLVVRCMTWTVFELMTIHNLVWTNYRRSPYQRWCGCSIEENIKIPTPLRGRHRQILFYRTTGLRSSEYMCTNP